MSVDPEVLEVASVAVGEALHSPERLDSPNLVFRAQTGTGGSVVVKRVTMTEWNRGDGDESEQLLNEWTVLEHLGGHVAPRLLAADRAASLIVIEDFGDRPTVQYALLESSTENGRQLLAEMGTALARMHGAGVGREAEMRAAQESRSTLTPRSDSTVDFRVERRDLFEAAFQTLGVPVHQEFWPEVDRLEAAVHDGELFRTLIHADAGPQNFLVGDEMRMIDFEFGVYLNAMCDVGGARGGFPQTEDARTVRPSDCELLEDAYRTEAATLWPEAEDDVFDEHLLMGTGHWALNRLAGGWRQTFGPMVEGTYEKSDGTYERQHPATLWAGFCDSADEADLLGPISTTLRSVLESLQGRFDDMVPFDHFPALRNEGDSAIVC